MVCGRELGLVNLHKLSTQWRPHLVKETLSGQGDPIWSRRPYLVKENPSDWGGGGGGGERKGGGGGGGGGGGREKSEMEGEGDGEGGRRGGAEVTGEGWGRKE